MWPSPCKLFLDIESEEDVVRRRTVSGGDEIAPTETGATGGTPQSDETPVRPRDRPYSYRPSTQSASDTEPSSVSARLVREKLFRCNVAESRPVIQQSLLCSSPVRSIRARLELSPERYQPYMSALETPEQTLYSTSSVQAPVLGVSSTEDRVRISLQPVNPERSRPLPSAVEFPSRPLYSVAGNQRPLFSAVSTGESSLGAAGITTPVCSLPTSWYSFQRPALPPVMASSSKRNGRLFGVLGMFYYYFIIDICMKIFCSLVCNTVRALFLSAKILNTVTQHRLFRQCGLVWRVECCKIQYSTNLVFMCINFIIIKIH